MKSERIQAYKDHLLDEEAKKQEEFEIRKWNMLQRFKKDEAIRKYENDINRRSYDATREYRIVWNQQIVSIFFTYQNIFTVKEYRM